MSGDIAILERALSLHPVDGWSATGKHIISCSTVKAAIEAGAAFVRTGHPPEKPAYRVLDNGQLRPVTVRWVMTAMEINQ